MAKHILNAYYKFFILYNQKVNMKTSIYNYICNSDTSWNKQTQRKHFLIDPKNKIKQNLTSKLCIYTEETINKRIETTSHFIELKKGHYCALYDLKIHLECLSRNKFRMESNDFYLEIKE